MSKRAVYVRRYFPDQHRPVRAGRTGDVWSVTNYRGVTFTLTDDVFKIAFRKAH